MTNARFDSPVAAERHGESSEYTSPLREVANSALSLAAVVGITLLGSFVLHRIAGRLEDNH